jgi:hypothetical protein
MTAGKPVPDQSLQRVPAYLAAQGIKESEWQYISKLGLKVLMRPGWPLKVRIWACLMVQSHGYKSGLAVMQVKGDAKGDRPKLLPLMAGGIVKMLLAAAIEAFRESGIEPTDEQRSQFKLDRNNVRRTVEEMELEDGAIVRARVNCELKTLIGYDSFEDAAKRGVVTPLAKLTQIQRNKLQHRSVIFVLAKPNPATANALNRQADFAQVVKNDHLETELRGAVQLIFAIMRRQGLTGGPEFAAELAKLPEVLRAVDSYNETTTTLKEQLKQADKFMRDLVARVAARTLPSEEPAAPEPDPRQPQLFDSSTSRPSPSERAEKIPPVVPRVEQPEGSVIGASPDQLRVFQRAAARDSRSDLVEVANRIIRPELKWGTPDADAPVLILQACRRADPKCRAEEIAHEIAEIGAKATKSAGKSDTNWWITSLVKKFQGGNYESIRQQRKHVERAGPRCFTCKKPLSDFEMVIEGSCAACANARMAVAQ